MLATLLIVGAIGAGAGAADAAPACSGARLRVGIDIGHSRRQYGATSAAGLPEYKFNARFAEELVAKSRRRDPVGIALDLFIHNPDGADMDLAERPRHAEKLGAQVLISIHHDSAYKTHLVSRMVGGKSLEHAPHVRGYSLFVSRDNPRFARSQQLASLIGRSFRIAQMVPTNHHAEDLPGERRQFLDRELGVYEAPFVVLAQATVPAVLVEVGVIANIEEERDLERTDYRGRIQLALLEALSAFCAGRKAIE